MEQTAKLVVFTGAFAGVPLDRKPEDMRVAVRADLVTMVERGRYNPQKAAEAKGTNVRFLKLTPEEQADMGKEMTVIYLATGQTIPVVEDFDCVVRVVEEGKKQYHIHLAPQEERKALGWMQRWGWA